MADIREAETLGDVIRIHGRERADAGEVQPVRLRALEDVVAEDLVNDLRRLPRGDVEIVAVEAAAD